MVTIFNNLLAKAVIKRSMTLSVGAVMEVADRATTRSTYILKVLQSSPGTRATVKSIAQTSNSVGQKQLVGILTVFEILSPENKAAFIESYKTCATIASLGTRDVSYQHTWQAGHVPPHQLP